ncbi:hypothetical protein [Gracilibacillus xinjiangensis]|uniref:Uncharacterized protein n=1 Tax=Gracilibacillus xinjiangensis TaxID=1193282 RepID=A0ABV8WT58_9BACI
MEGSIQQKESKKKNNKIIPIVVAVAVILIAGIITVTALQNTSGKEDYFLAEKNTVEQLESAFKERYEDELLWLEHSEENAIESTLEITGQVNAPELASMGYDQIINNANITIESAIDKKEKVSSANISAGFSGIELSGIEGYINGNELYVGLPFLNDIIQLNGEDLGRILHEIDPSSFTGEEKIDFTDFFTNSSLVTEDVEYLKEEYVDYLYKEIPEDAFESESEKVSINSNDVTTEKITFHLSEEELRTILQNLFNKMAEDERLREIIIDQATYMNFASVELAETELATFEEDFVSELELAADRIQDVAFPDGFTSVIWVNDGIIVKRDLSLTAENVDNTTTGGIRIEGTNAVTDNEQQIDYTVTVTEDDTEESINFSADLSHQDGETNDIITLSMDDVNIVIEANQSGLEDGGKSFERMLSFEEAGANNIALHWLGETNYEEDQMTADHTFFVEDGMTINQDTISIFVKETGSTIDKVEVPSPDQVKNLSEMSGDEIIEYFETDVMSQLEGWMMNLMGPGI